MSRDTEKKIKEKKLAEALRGNLLKRKQQARGQNAAPDKEKK